MKALLAVAFFAAPAIAACAIAPANAANCPDVEVIFARGRSEAPGIGWIGNAFVDAVRSKTDKSVGVYAVVYDADADVIGGANDMSRRIQYMSANCPNTRQVLGGYSLGAAVTDIVLGADKPGFGYTSPLPPSANDHIAAIALFGNGTQAVFGPVAEISPNYGGKTIDVCTDMDLICRGRVDPNDPGGSWAAHLQPAYIDSGAVDGAADFVVARL